VRKWTRGFLTWLAPRPNWHIAVIAVFFFYALAARQERCGDSMCTWGHLVIGRWEEGPGPIFRKPPVTGQEATASSKEGPNTTEGGEEGRGERGRVEHRRTEGREGRGREREARNATSGEGERDRERGRGKRRRKERRRGG